MQRSLFFRIMRYAQKVGRLKEVDIFMSMKKKFDTKYSLEFMMCGICEFIPYWKGTEKQTNSHRIVKQAEKETLYQKAYTYGALNRIISEKDIDKEQEICYTYDNNGNILTKSVNGVVTSYAYEEGTDRLTSYGAETIGYDGMGNPKSYRGAELTWEKGCLLTSIEDEAGEVTFGYVVFGCGSVADGIIIGATISAAGNLFSQTVIEGKSFSEVNYLHVCISALTGALSAIPVVGLMGSVGISFGSGLIGSLIEGNSIGDVLISGLWSAATTFAAGMVLRGIGMAKIVKVGKGNYAGKKIFLNHQELNGLRSFSPAINKTTSLVRYIYSNIGLGGLSKLAANTAGVGIGWQ